MAPEITSVMGLGKGFIHMIKVLYSAPSAMIWTLTLFSVARSSRQGCPLSPGLFALSLEPLVQCIRQSQDIIPISIQGSLHHIALYADDVLIFMRNPSTSTTRVLSVIEEFGNLSGFKINWPKSEPYNRRVTTSPFTPMDQFFYSNGGSWSRQ